MKSFFLFLTILLLNNCSGFTPLYKNHSFLNEQLKNIAQIKDGQTALEVVAKVGKITVKYL